MKPTVSIIVPCRNERDHIEVCLRSVLAQESSIGEFEVIIADGMSDDGTLEILKQLEKEDSRLRIIDNPGRIVASGLNSAIRQARGDIIIRMDSHTKYAPDYIQNCVAVLKETKADNVGGPWVAEGQGFVGKAIAAAFQSGFSNGGALGHDPNYEGDVDTVYLGCWPREAFDRSGLFDEEFVRNQDDELNLRVRRTGGKIWQSPRIKSTYYPRESLRSLFQQQLQYGYWKVRVIQKHKLPASIRHLVPTTFVLSLIILPLASALTSLAAWAWLGILGTYSACSLSASLLAARRAGWRIFPLIPLVFFCYHFPYGLGFLQGVWDFVVVRRAPTQTYTKLTRTSSDQTSPKASVRA
jgi:cellulose synthase/poly-beta-1,6-N-acetylglucosamine synthase-like glycosyltransferase